MAKPGNGGGIGGECFVLDIAGGFTIDGIGKIRTEFLQIDLVDAAADFLVGREQDLDCAMLELRIVDQESRRIHDFGKPGLVVGAEQRGAVGGDDVVADLVGKGWMFGGADDLRGVARQHDVAAAIIPDDLRLDVLAGAVGRGVHVRTEADDRDFFVRVRRKRGVDIAVLVEMRIAQAHRLQFGREQGSQLLLFFGGRVGRGGGV